MNKLKIILALMLFSTIKVKATGQLSPWATHLSPLVAAVVNTKGPVMELGCGHYSTPILHTLCFPSKRKLLSIESNQKWISSFIYLESDWHKFLYVPQVSGWDSVGENERWAVVFVDHAPAGRRKIDIQRLRNNVDIFVVHDSETIHDNIYDMEHILSSFKYRYNYVIYKTQTTLVSDIINVREFFDI